MTDANEIRSRSLSRCESLGARPPPELPPVWVTDRVRSREELARRACGLAAVVAAAFGMRKAPELKRWVERKRLLDVLSDEEVGQFGLDLMKRPRVQAIKEKAVELQTIAWALGIADHLLFNRVCQDDLIERFPQPETDMSSDLPNFGEGRPITEILLVRDVVKCLRAAFVAGNPPSTAVRYIVDACDKTLGWVVGEIPGR